MPGTQGKIASNEHHMNCNDIAASDEGNVHEPSTTFAVQCRISWAFLINRLPLRPVSQEHRTHTSLQIGRCNVLTNLVSPAQCCPGGDAGNASRDTPPS